MKKITPKVILKVTVLLFLLSFFLKSCEKDQDNFAIENENLTNRKFNTIPLKQAKEFFLQKQKKMKSTTNPFPAKSSNMLDLTPNWESLGYEDLYEIDEAQLTTVNVAVNRKGNYKSKLIFINVNGVVKNAIYTIYESKHSPNGTVLDARIYLNEIDGTFIDGYEIKNRKFVKRYIFKPKSKVNKAAFFLFFQEDTEDDCWNTDNLPEGEELDEVDLGTVSGGGGGNNSDNAGIYTTISNWNNSGSSNHDSGDYGGSGGGGYTGVAGTIYGSTVDTEEESAEDDNFDEQVFIDDEFKKEPCLKDVYDNMGKASKFQEYLENFEPEFSVAHLRFKYDENFGSNYPDQTTALAITQPPINGANNSNVANYNINITFNGDVNLDASIHNKPKLIIAVAFMHEMIHAEVFRKMLSAAQQGHLNIGQYTTQNRIDYVNSLKNNFPGIYDYYKERWKPNWGHEQMAQHYIDIIVSALKEYDSNQHSQAQYNAIAWLGLEGTVAWNNLTLTERDNITQTRTNFIENDTDKCD